MVKLSAEKLGTMSEYNLSGITLGIRSKLRIRTPTVYKVIMMYSESNFPNNLVRKMLKHHLDSQYEFSVISSPLGIFCGTLKVFQPRTKGRIISTLIFLISVAHPCQRSDRNIFGTKTIQTAVYV